MAMTPLCTIGRMVRWFVVEGSASDRAIFADALRQVDGVDVDMFASAGDMLDRLDAGDRPDLVFLSLGLRDMDESEVIAEIREESATATLPIALLSDTSDDERIDRAYRNGANIFFGKPSSIDELVRLFQTTRDQWSCALLAH